MITIKDNYIVRVETLVEAQEVVAKFEGEGYNFAPKVEKFNCYYVAREAVDGVNNDRFVVWGRDEVRDAEDFHIATDFKTFMGYTEMPECDHYKEAEVVNDTIVMPRSITAENGVKALLIGDWFESVTIKCSECDRGEDSHGEECEVCDGVGEYEQKVPIEWTTMKDMYKEIVKHFNEQ